MVEPGTMIRYTKFLLLAALAVSTWSCHQPSTVPSQRPGAESRQEVQRLRDQVQNGDKIAAEALSLHYMFNGSAPDAERFHWLVKSAETGNSDSMRFAASYAVVTKRCDAAEYWFERWWSSKSPQSDSHRQDMSSYREDLRSCRSLLERSSSTSGEKG